MSLSKEWKNRINIWLEELQRHFYKKCLDVDFEGFFTMDHLSIQEVSKETFSPMPVGTKWGKKWEYGWFKATIVIPKELEGETIALKIGLGPEMLVYVNGEESGAIDHKHFEIILSKQALPLQKFEIICECYAGHGLRPENGKPTPPGEIALPEPEYFQVCIKESSIGTWNNDAFNLYADAFVLLSLRNNINENLLRVSNIDKALKDFTIITDFELETKQRNESFKMAIETLKPLLLCVNGSTAPEMYTFGQSHLDLAWLWSVAETKRKSARTISSFIALIKDYPNTKFLITQAPVFLYLKEYYPNLYEKVKQNIENGSIIAEGAMWLESDTNLPSGESLVRQFIYGKKFLKEEFDIDGKLLWLPDCFGFSAALPQIMQGCRVPYFSTQKISKSYNHTKLFPYNNFYWEGIDGTQVLSHVYKNINSETDPATIPKWHY